MSFNVKALGAFRKLGAAALITATTLALAGLSTSCKQAPTPTPKHVITFSVEGGNGTLKAKADGVPETSTSPINVEEGKTVTFTAKANAGYRVKSWTLDGKPITEAGTNTEYKLKVSKSATVKVSFEAIPPTKYTVTLTQTEGGTVTALPEIPADKLMPKDTEITFTAKADTGYKVGKWTVTPAEALQAGTGADGSESAKVKITADTTVSVSFIKKTYAVNFSVEGGTGGTLEAKVDGKEISSGDMVEHGKKVEFTPKEEKGYRVKKWTLDGENIGGTAYFTLGVSKPATVTVSFELSPVEGGAVLILDPDKLTIEVRAVTEDGSAITVEGCEETTLKKGKYTELHAKGTKVILKGKIIELHCPKNQLTALNVQGLTALQGLYCGGNKLTALDVQGLTSLQKLDCSYNQLPELNVQGLTALQELHCSKNQLTALNVQGLTALQGLYCGGNKLTALNVQGLSALKWLSCSNNKLTELNVQGLTTLWRLDCSNNQLTSLNVQGLNALRWISCSDNQIKAQAMTKLLNALPARESGNNAEATLYTEKTGVTEGNCKDYTQPAELKDAFDGAKDRNWKLKKYNANGMKVDI